MKKQVIKLQKKVFRQIIKNLKEKDQTRNKAFQKITEGAKMIKAYMTLLENLNRELIWNKDDDLVLNRIIGFIEPFYKILVMEKIYVKTEKLKSAVLLKYIENEKQAQHKIFKKNISKIKKTHITDLYQKIKAQSEALVNGNFSSRLHEYMTDEVLELEEMAHKLESDKGKKLFHSSLENLLYLDKIYRCSAIEIIPSQKELIRKCHKLNKTMKRLRDKDIFLDGLDVAQAFLSDDDIKEAKKLKEIKRRIQISRTIIYNKALKDISTIPFKLLYQ